MEVIAVKMEQITKDGVQFVSLEKTPALTKAQKEQGRAANTAPTKTNV